MESRLVRRSLIDNDAKAIFDFQRTKVPLLISIQTQPASGPNKTQRVELVSGFCDLVATRVADHWRPTLLTFLFEQLATSSETGAIARMLDEVDRVYRTLATRVTRDPHDGKLPIMLAAVDAPVMKSSKSGSIGARQNGGLHAHAVLLIPEDSRLKVSAAEHFSERQDLYVRPDRPLASIHAEPIVDDERAVTDYAFKSVKSGRLPYDDAVLILPRTSRELSGR